MSNINIPGVSNQYNTSKIIADTMKLKRIPLKRLQKQVASIKKNKAAWSAINTKIGAVRTAAQSLYSFNNPFEDMVVQSSNPALSGTAKRGAPTTKDEITIKKIATADSFLSSSLPDNFQVPSGDYGFQVGDKHISFHFGGGSVKDFVNVLNKKGHDLLRANVVKNTSRTQVMQITSKKTGVHNKLTFTKDSQQLGVKMGFLHSTGTTARTVALTSQNIQAWNKPLSEVKPQIAGGKVTLDPGGEISIPISPPVAAQKDLVLEVKVKVTDIPHGQKSAETPPSGPSLPSTGSIEYKGLKIQSGSSKSGLPPYKPPPPPKVVNDLSVLYMQGASKTVKLPAVKDTQGVQTLQFPLSGNVGTLNALDVRNNNTYRKITIEGVRVFNPNSRGKYSPAHAVSKAGDAVLNLNGIEIRRPSNSISDVIPRVTLHLHAPTSRPATVQVNPDMKKIKNEIINFVGTYNKLMTDLVIYSSNNPKVIQENSYLTPQQQQKAQNNLGLLQGSLTLSEIRSRLEDIMMNPYPTPAGNALDLLAQIGISTDVSKTYQGFSMAKLRGYLQIDTTTLDNALQNHFNSVKALFGYAGNGNLVVNSGVAYELDKYLKAYNQPDGIIPMKEQSYDQSIKQTNQQIDTMKQRLAQKEQQLKQRYSQMQGTINQLQQSSKAIQQLGGGGGGGGGSSSPGIP